MERTTLKNEAVEICKHCGGTWPQHISDPNTARCQCKPDCKCVTFELKEDE